MKTALLYDPQLKQHDNGRRHPERAARLEAIEAALQRDALWEQVTQRAFEAATKEQLALCHTAEHIARVRELAEQGGGKFDSDTAVSPASYDVAKLAAGAAIGAVDAVMRGECDNAFAIVRPPGHHATPDRAMGFCLFNSVAIAARYAQREYSLRHVAILDWDVHHGNGTQDVFYEDPSVFFCSVHQAPLYPYSGARAETGSGAGAGSTLNFPLPSGCGLDEYMHVWEKAGHELDSFAPELIVLSAGFDAHCDDPLGGMNLTADDFAQLLRVSKRWAKQLCEGRLVCVLEGGYDLDGLGDSVAAVIKEMLRDD
jgi:acetoin utilization deacetylase AcuC-like enzyme